MHLRIPFCRFAGTAFAALTLCGVCAGARAGEGREAVAGTAPSGLMQTVDRSLLVAAASAELKAWLSHRTEKFEIDPDLSATAPPLLVTGGAIDLRARRIPADARPANRMAVWLDVHVGGKFVRSALIGFRVRAHAQAWAANADLAAGTRLNTQLLMRKEVDVTSAGALPWNGDPAGWVLRTRLLTGNFLVAGSVAPAMAVSRGDSVHLRSRIGGVEVVAQAHALQDANVSQRVRLRVDAARGPVLATVLEPGWAEIAQ
jgi:flagella basal body P-ring formation protein FlgA